MDKRQTANWNRQLKLRKVRDDHAGVKISGLVQRALARHEALLGEAETLMSTPAGRSQGATLKKSTEEKRAIAAALPVANALHLLYLEDEDDEQASEKAYALRLNKSDYSSLPGALTLAETRNVAKQAQAMKDLLAKEAEIDGEDLEELDKANEKLSKLLAAPKTAIETGKTTRTALGTALKAADKYANEGLRAAIKTMKGEAAGFRDALLEALRIDDAAGPAATDTKPTPQPDPQG